eukprot:438062_1
MKITIMHPERNDGDLSPINAPPLTPLLPAVDNSGLLIRMNQPPITPLIPALDNSGHLTRMNQHNLSNLSGNDLAMTMSLSGSQPPQTSAYATIPLVDKSKRSKRKSTFEKCCPTLSSLFHIPPIVFIIIYVTLGSAFEIAISSIIAAYADLPWIFPSLGAMAFLHFV